MSGRVVLPNCVKYCLKKSTSHEDLLRALTAAREHYKVLKRLKLIGWIED